MILRTRFNIGFFFNYTELKGSYTFDFCAMNNTESIHCITKRVDLKKISTSNAPISLEAIPLSSSSISLSWIPGTFDAIDLFEVCFGQTNNTSENLKCFEA